MFPSAETLIIFVATTVTVLVIPGPSVVYVMTRGIEQGPAAGLLAMLGLETGALLHAVAAAAGLAAVLQSSPTAFAVVRYAGALYLLYLAYVQVRTCRGVHADPTGGRRPSSPWRLYRDGVLVDLLNPKTSLFFVAFLPQFVDRARPYVEVQMMALGLCFVLLAGVCDGTYAVVAGRVGRRLRGSTRARTRLGWASGAVYVALAGVAVAA